MGGSPDFGVLVPVEFLKCFIDSVLQSGWASVTDDVQDPCSDPDILVVNQLKDSVPEDLDVFEYFAWAKLFGSFESDITIFTVSIFQDDVHVIGIPALGHDFFLVRIGNACVLLPIVCTLWHNNLLSAVVLKHSNLSNKINSLIKSYLSNSYKWIKKLAIDLELCFCSEKAILRQLSFLIYDECMTFIISQSKPHSVNFINKMDKSSYPIPHSHKTFDFGSTTIDSNFDSGNLYNA